ncbi:DUF3944 domain-containing protein [uncultured Fusobacterium sp.]|uniref:DUF3944 domain-containing protein n=1 Tax=uncultured Fusobacterium sp. TaxID=159267 RepID=UPI002619D692|nr:DUF3944 domain-containing protein [uncultured Fusobacterium sp.]
MAYVHDEDLEFLGGCTHKQLENLAKIIIYDTDGKIRRTEEVTKTSEYKKYGEYYNIYWKILVADFQKFGGNTFVNLFRNGGVKYDEILKDILLLKDTFFLKQKKISIFKKEELLLRIAISIILDDMKIDNKKSLVKNLELNVSNYNSSTILKSINTKLLENNLFFEYQLSNTILEYIVKNRIDYILLRKISTTLAIPLASVNITDNVLGEAKRVTIPASIIIACLRRISNYEKRYKKENE